MATKTTTGTAKQPSPEGYSHGLCKRAATIHYLQIVEKWCKSARKNTTTLTVFIAKAEWQSLREAMVMRNSFFAKMGFLTRHVSNPTIAKPRKQMCLLYKPLGSSITILIDEK
jgi:hypothetical protein